jgi:type III secretion protein V
VRERFGFLRKLLRVEEPSSELERHEALLADGSAIPPAPGLLLEIDRSVAEPLTTPQLRAALVDMAQRVREEFGVPVPQPTLRVRDQLASGEYRLYAFGVRIGAGTLRTDAHFTRTPEMLPPGQELAAATTPFQPELEGRWLVGVATKSDANDLSPLELLTVHTRRAVQRHLSLFIGIQETANLFNRMSRDYPDLVKEMLRVVAPQRVADILKRLVDESIPIRNLRDVFEAITEAGGREKDIVLLTEYVRVALRRHISDRYAAIDRTLKVLVVHPELEDKLRNSVRVSSAGTQLAIDPEVAARVIGEIGQWKRSEHGIAGMVLLCSLDVRRHLRKLTEVEFFDLPVLSFQELVPDIRLIPLGQLNA